MKVKCNFDGNGEVHIEWPCHSVVASRKCENKLRPLLHRKGEWGRGRDLPASRKEEIRVAAEAQGMDLYQALSLRRGILRAMPGGMRRVNQSTAMGTHHGKRDVTDLFEQAVLSFLDETLPKAYQECNKEYKPNDFYRTEAQLLQEMRSGVRPRGPTPDILFLRPIHINGHKIQWMDAKQYYASAILADNPNIPNGKLKRIAERHDRHYGGRGAFVFARGYCKDLEPLVPGAILLDATPLDMSSVEAYQDAS